MKSYISIFICTPDQCFIPTDENGLGHFRITVECPQTMRTRIRAKLQRFYSKLALSLFLVLLLSTIRLSFGLLDHTKMFVVTLIRTSKPKMSSIAKDMSLSALLITALAFLTSQLNSLEYNALLRASLKK